jgi:phosphoinositide-3-kinase, regulatory subunit 4
MFTTFSFSSRINHDPDAQKNLKTVGDVELQKLGVVPQTVFLKTRASDTNMRSPRISRRSTSDMPLRVTSRSSRVSSVDHGSSVAPFDDLRRRLATINASNSSVNVTLNSRERRDSLSSSVQPSPPGVTGLPHTSDRPGSPTESVVSTSNSSALRAVRGLHVGGIGGHKAAPAVGSSKANATGLLEAPSKLRSDGSPDESGRSSPVSMSGTLRESHRIRVASSLPISTYGV